MKTVVAIKKGKTDILAFKKRVVNENSFDNH
jgi:hypothetical protein